MLRPWLALNVKSRLRPSLRHPNIVAADDAAEANGVHFLVMEYVEGKDLSAMVKKDGPFPVNKAVNYILQAARGLEFAHSEGRRSSGHQARQSALGQEGRGQDSRHGAWPALMSSGDAGLKPNLPARARSWAPWITWPRSKP